MNEATIPYVIPPDEASAGGKKSGETRRLMAELMPADPYVKGELRRVREQIHIASRAYKKAKTPADVWRLANALAKLREDERKLAGRPDPGSYRPSAPPKKAKSQGGEVE